MALICLLENMYSELLIEVHLEVLKPVNDSEELNRSYVGYFCNSCFVSTLLNVIGNVSLKPFFFSLQIVSSHVNLHSQQLFCALSDCYWADFVCGSSPSKKSQEESNLFYRSPDECCYFSESAARICHEEIYTNQAERQQYNLSDALIKSQAILIIRTVSYQIRLFWLQFMQGKQSNTI